MKFLVIFLLSFALFSQSPDPRSQGILDLTHSPKARMQNIPVRAVRMGDGFWTARMRVNIEKRIPTMLDLLDQHGPVDNFRRLSGGTQAPHAVPPHPHAS